MPHLLSALSDRLARRRRACNGHAWRACVRLRCVMMRRVFAPAAQAGARLIERWAFYFCREAVCGREESLAGAYGGVGGSA